ncbi:hypothetical protein FOZ63_025314 [Perkinsus olseni]|uniref:Sorl1p n=1 Tax=Perkinsus olseni TaxID=32597 RepID=A0A7J6TSD2_PEROL|nr:hypothetical protein FOZ63_025314 [Perkinsus olseni]
MMVVKRVLLLVSALCRVYSTDYCDTTCSITPNCTSSYCTEWKSPAVCHGILMRSDGSLCAATDGAQNCRGSAVGCDTVFTSSSTITTTTTSSVMTTTVGSGTTANTFTTSSTTTTSSTSASPMTTVMPSFDDLRGSWCNTYAGVDPEALWVVDFLTFHDNGDLLLQSRGVAFIMQYFWEGNTMYVYDLRSEGGGDPGFSSLRFTYSVVDGIGELTGYLKVESMGVFYPSGVKNVCGPVTTRFPGPSTATSTRSTTSSGPTVTPTEDALAGTWCGEVGDTFDSIGFSGNTLAIRYNGEVYFMQFFWEGNRLYTYDADPVLEAEISLVFSAIKMSYFVNSLSVQLGNEHAGTYTRGGTCAPLAGVAGVTPPSVATLSYTTWCFNEDTDLPPFNIRFTESYMTLQIFSGDYFNGWKNPVLAAAYQISSSDIRLTAQDDGFSSLLEFAQGNFRLVFHGDWLTLIRQNGEHLPHPKIDRC